MANVSVTRSIPMPPPPGSVEQVHLSLSHDEALVVAMLVGNVGGNRLAPVRVLSEGIWDAMEKAGLLGGRQAPADSAQYNRLREQISIGRIEAIV